MSRNSFKRDVKAEYILITRRGKRQYEALYIVQLVNLRNGKHDFHLNMRGPKGDFTGFGIGVSLYPSQGYMVPSMVSLHVIFMYTYFSSKKLYFLLLSYYGLFVIGWSWLNLSFSGRTCVIAIIVIFEVSNWSL